MKNYDKSRDNFARFHAENSEESHGVEEIYRAIKNISDPILRNRVYQRMNVELGVILLRKAEIQEELRKIFETELLDKTHKDALENQHKLPSGILSAM